MIKKLIIPVIVLSFFFTGCEETTYEYLDKNSLYKFKVGDTLLYNGVINIDTFEVSRVETYMQNYDKIHNVETLGITVTQVNKNCTSYCYGFSLVRSAEQSTTIQFRNNIRSLTSVNSSNNEYQIGQRVIKNVYIIENQWAELDNEKNVNAIWYTHNYGIIAYKLISDEVFVLDEKCFDGLME